MTGPGGKVIKLFDDGHGSDGLAEPVTGRTCGSCQACCVALGIEALGKPEWRRCSNQCAKGCDIYASRPAECATYRCQWLAGAVGDARDRPDRLGLIFDMPSVLTESEAWAGIPGMFCRETREGASSSKRGAARLSSIARRLCVVIVNNRGQHTSMIGPPSLVAEVNRRALVIARETGGATAEAAERAAAKAEEKAR